MPNVYVLAERQKSASRCVSKEKRCRTNAKTKQHHKIVKKEEWKPPNEKITMQNIEIIGLYS